MMATMEQIKEMEKNTKKVVKTSFTLDSETIKGIKQIIKGHKKASLPILNSLLFEVVNKNVVKVTYTNADLTIEKMFLTTENEINTSKFIIPIEVIKGLKYVKKGELFTFVENNKETMELIRNSVVQRIYIGNVEDYPTFGYEKEEFEVVETSTGYEYFDNNDLQSLVKATISVSDSVTRPVLTQVIIRDKSVISTDSHRLYKSDSVFNHNKEILLSPALIHKANELIAKNTFMKMSVSNYNVKITDDMTTTIYHRQIEGNYPDISRLLPTEFNYQIKINKVKELNNYLKNLKNANVKNHVVNAIINVNTHKLELESKTEIGIAKIELPIDLLENKNEDFKISFSSKYFLNAIEQLDNEVFTLNFVSNMRPFIIKKDNSDKELALILPIRTI